MSRPRLSSILAKLLPAVQVTLDPTHKQLVAVALPHEHERVKAILDQLAHPPDRGVGAQALSDSTVECDDAFHALDQARAARAGDRRRGRQAVGRVGERQGSRASGGHLGHGRSRGRRATTEVGRLSAQRFAKQEAASRARSIGGRPCRLAQRCRCRDGRFECLGHAGSTRASPLDHGASRPRGARVRAGSNRCLSDPRRRSGGLGLDAAKRGARPRASRAIGKTPAWPCGERRPSTSWSSRQSRRCSSAIRPGASRSWPSIVPRRPKSPTSSPCSAASFRKRKLSATRRTAISSPGEPPRNTPRFRRPSMGWRIRHSEDAMVAEVYSAPETDPSTLLLLLQAAAPDARLVANTKGGNVIAWAERGSTSATSRGAQTSRRRARERCAADGQGLSIPHRRRQCGADRAAIAGAYGTTGGRHPHRQPGGDRAAERT